MTSSRASAERKRRSRGSAEIGRAFTLIEVLVVVSIIVLLVSLLVPSLSRARDQAKLAACKSNLHQIGTALQTYAYPSGLIPFGPDVQPLGSMLEDNDGTKATNQIWTGPQEPTLSYMALGLLMTRSLAFPELLYCPADDSYDPVEELAVVRGRQFRPGYCSYMYRQLDETDGRGKVESLGSNGVGRKAVALAMDMNSTISFDPAYYRTNHKARKVNVLYVDASVLSFDNTKDPFTIRDQDLMDMVGRRDEMLQSADAGYFGRRP